MNDSEPAEWHEYDYALLRVVPRVQTGEFLNVGVLLHSRTAGFLGMRWCDPVIIRSLDLPKGLEISAMVRHLEAFKMIADGESRTGFLGTLTPSERFHWLTAPRSAVIQPSELHTGRTLDPAATLEQIFRETCHIL